jgi:hypothetical protein
MNRERMAQLLQGDFFVLSDNLKPAKKPKRRGSNPRGALLYCSNHGLQIARNWDRHTDKILLDCGCTRTKQLP